MSWARVTVLTENTAHRHARKRRRRAEASLHLCMRARTVQVCASRKLHGCLQNAVSQASPILAAVVLMLSPMQANAISPAPTVQESKEEGLTIKFRASKDPKIRKAQESLVETWGYVTTQFLDTNFNGVDWQHDLQVELDAAALAQSPQEVYKVTAGMLKKLGDPFTRFMPPGSSTAFENVIEGQVVSMGFQLAEDKEGALRVSFVAVGSPAEQAGVQIGDKLVSIDGQDANQLRKEQLAALSRSAANVVLERSNNNSSVPQQVNLHLDARPIDTHPVQFAALPGQSGKIGYVRLIVFSRNAPQDVADAIHSLQGEGVQSLVLDLRDNAGGVVLAGYQVAQLFLPQGAGFCYVEDGRGASEDVQLAESQQITSQPMAVLVNGGTASTAELMAASLQDNKRAVLVGEKTFGKGRTQRVIKLRDNGLLLLSNTAYQTPSHKPVDKVGLSPDVACKPDFTEVAFWNSGNQDDSQNFLADPCINVAIDSLAAQMQ